MLLEELVHPRDFAFVEPDVSTELVDDGNPALLADPVSRVVADDRPGRRGRNYKCDVESSEGRECGGCYQRGLARKRNAETLDSYKQKNDQVTVGPDQIIKRLVHLLSGARERRDRSTRRDRL